MTRFSTKIGLFGGTFDPIHDGHLSAARAVLEALNLDKVLFVPAGDPYMKTTLGRVSSAFHRMEMVTRALNYENEVRFCVSDLEIGRVGPSYTLDTIESLNLPKEKLVVIVGVDALLSFHRWKDPGRIIKKARLAVITRPGTDISRVDEVSRKGFLDNLEVISSTTSNISSTQIREQSGRGNDIHGVCPPVKDYIFSHCLYNSLAH
jgi:nicotinate-nucleotide adenylyltransferase